MNYETSIPHIGADDFARRFSMRAGNLMWLLGAGASASAGIPTAGDMVWEFKQQLFISQRHVSLQAVADLSSPAIRTQLQAHIDSSENLPSSGAPDEYAALFEAVYPAEADRRTYLDGRQGGRGEALLRSPRARYFDARETHATRVDYQLRSACR